MTDQILLAKPKLQDGWCDLSVGEATIIRRSLFGHFPDLCSPNILMINQELTVNDLQYQPPAGYNPLIDLLEEKHNAPVVITNGAKQALGSVFYALKKRGTDLLWMRSPYWALIPPLAHIHGLECVFSELIPSVYSSPLDSYLCIAPNNPNNYCEPYDTLVEMAASFKKANMPFIHDAAYFTPSYLPEDYTLGPVGDVQIFSVL